MHDARGGCLLGLLARAGEREGLRGWESGVAAVPPCCVLRCVPSGRGVRGRGVHTLRLRLPGGLALASMDAGAGGAGRNGAM